jgi:flavorubredoxin
MNALIIYDSLYGNTEEIAEAIASSWRQYGNTRVVAASTANAIDLLGVSLLAIGGPTQKHGLSPAMEDLLDRLATEKLAKLPVVAFDTRVPLSAWLAGSAAEVIARRLGRQGIAVALPPESFFVEGREGPLKKGEAERAARWAYQVIERVAAPLAPGGR